MTRVPTIDRLTLDAALTDVGVLLLCGGGGVGKTSVAASLALEEARRGRRVCVLTIDPARRLADALGITLKGDKVKKVAVPDPLVPGGSLHAQMLDARSAFDQLVGETAHSPEQRERILANRVYRSIADHSIGMQEYMALERLHALDRSGRYDLIVVDTPPAAHAVDLLEAPGRLLRFFEGRSLRWFLKPGLRMSNTGLRMLGGAQGMLVSLITRITGVEMLRDATEFFEAFDGMYDTFSERVRVAERILVDERTGFIVVARADDTSLDDAAQFWQLAADRGLRHLGTVINRMEPRSATTPKRAVRTANVSAHLADATSLKHTLCDSIAQSYADHALIAQQERDAVQRFGDLAGGSPVVRVPRLAHDVRDLALLLELGAALY